MFWSLLKRFLFLLEPETAHRLTVVMIRIGIRLRKVPLRIASGQTWGRALPSPSGTGPKVFGMEFGSKVGLAAGFDKDAEILAGLPALGFGFAEIGTVTPRPQAGNDRPRLFREPSREALFNRMGFNGLGSDVVSRRLRALREAQALPESFRVGVNLGKNKDTALEDAPRDYERAARAFEGLADYLVINVSSPNTPGLRSLQTLDALKSILDAVSHVISQWTRRPPLLVKLAPEIAGHELGELIEGLEKGSVGVDGWILTNTLGGKIHFQGKDYPGGWSGKPLEGIAADRLREARARTKLPIISVGGILSPEEAKRRLEWGASLVQIYSGWIYKGPAFPGKIADFLNAREK